MSRWIAAVTLAGFALFAAAVPPEQDKKKGDDQSPEAAAGRAQIEGNLKATVWAAEPQFQNPIAFAFDEAGKCYVVEANRYKDGVPDTRGHMYWLDEDIGAKSVADRVAMYKKHKYPQFEKFDERIRTLWDSTGKGVADKAETFTSGYNRYEDGIAAGVLARKGSVYFTCIPDLYLLKDKDGDGKADEKQSLATGFGVRAQFQGHDLHGLRMGPDGKLYFSIGDRGMNVTNKEGKHLYYPDAGAVLRCDLDGSNLEIVHTGLRNPQELAFDDFGNLFTYDNNCDSGDSARWVYIVEGGDSGWRCGYQYGTHMHTKDVPQGNRGPWNTEKLWHLQHEGQPAYIIPPLAHFGNGPSGLTHYPGVGLNDKYKDHFFACDFTASAGNSKIWTLAVKPKGAAFEVVNLRPFVQGVVPTDCEFGPDGAFYWSDWLGGWDKPNKGRIFRATDAEAMKNPAIEEGRKLLLEGLKKKTLDELAKLLAHPIQNVRLEAQFELASRHQTADIDLTASTPTDILEKVAKEATNPLARYHAVWGLGMRAGRVKGVSERLAKLLSGADEEMKCQVLRTLSRFAELPASLEPSLRPSLTDASLRVRAIGLGAYAKLRPADNPDPEKFWPPVYAKFNAVFDVLKDNADKDAYLRQAAVHALFKMATIEPMMLDVYKQAGERQKSPAVRLAVLLALRQMQSPRVDLFLHDTEPKIVAEAARAIHDDNLMAALPHLAGLLDKPALPEAVAFRAISANFKLGTPEAAVRVANFAARASEADPLRISALKLLGEWAKPSKRDAVTGCRQELPDRDAKIAADALKPVVTKTFAGSDEVRKEAVKVVAKLGLTEVGPLLATLIADEKQSASTRADFLFALEAMKAKELSESAQAALASPEAKLRAAARVVLAKRDEKKAAQELPKLLKDDTASVIEKQMIFGVLGTMKESTDVDATLAEWLDAMIVDKVLPELKLDILEAAQARTTTKNLKLHAPLREKLADYDKTVRAKAGQDTVKRYPEALAGGDAAKGRDIFLNSAAVYCQRCHKLDGQGGDVGPVMNGIAAMKDRDYLLESIINPNAKIAMGYQSVILELIDGKQVSGIVKNQTAKEFTLITAENKLITIPADDVDGKPKPDKSAMPDDLYKKLTKRELRDVVEFLTTLKDPAKK